MSDLRALVLVCTLKPTPSDSSSHLLATEVVAALAEHGVDSSIVRVVDHDVKFGVTTDEGDGDEWPAIREQVLAADILVVATPIWLGQPSAVCKLVLERLDAEIGETDDGGRMLTFGKVAAVAVVGNEDGAHHVSAELYQALSDTGFTIPANAVTYWVGEAMQGTDYREKVPRPEKTAQTTSTLAANAAHLARLLKENQYPPIA
ncbi:flavodoxin family protein [Nocardioides sp. TF02-7]|uniref:flavodoxin family protein n=1 Tax=Nocardioides sp. TF02-7 TaxID=2917724 RepID=UPI001F06D87F|nr:flavodoxin family protein [Nocardioides sp. TF02-7]UMG92777.1 flavodoxin family protein [Nocardioides sp. TF02-7]